MNSRSLLLLLLLRRFSCVQLRATPEMAAHQAPLSLGFSKNTGVGCHFLLQCIKLKSENEVAQSCPTPSDPMDCSLPGSSVHGICQTRVLEWVAIAFSSRSLIQVKLYSIFSSVLGLFHLTSSGCSICYNSVFFKPDNFPTYHIVFIHLTINGYIDCFHL